MSPPFESLGLFRRSSADRSENATDILAIRVVGEPLAVRFDAISGVLGLSNHRRLVRVPGADPALLGVVAVRGVVMPVFSLADLLGVTGPREHLWFAWIDGKNPVGYAFDGIDGRAWLPPEALGGGDNGHPLLWGAALFAGTSRPLLHLDDGVQTSRAFASQNGAYGDHAGANTRLARAAA
ncbi:MAG: chemotaxis protein CheW [Pseudomonadota bacterium]|nr:chemotaxis protein CheW [Pseudomonadota bacterium]